MSSKDLNLQDPSTYLFEKRYFLSNKFIVMVFLRVKSYFTKDKCFKNITFVVGFHKLFYRLEMKMCTQYIRIATTCKCQRLFPAMS